MNATETASAITEHIRQHESALTQYWQTSGPVRHFYTDDLLPEETAQRIYHSLPAPDTLMLRHTDKERKRVGISVEKYAPEMAAILFAFQDPEVIKTISRITGLTGLQPDASLYGSGISQMLEGDFLLPHLDNSHDGDGRLYRVLNTLYYITPDWPTNAGGNLELWNKSMDERREIHARFNRLVVMETHTESVHSVNKVLLPGGMRACISNYYFSTEPANRKAHVHKTTFYARPEDSVIKKMKLNVEGTAKNFLSHFFRNNARSTKHRRK